MADSNSNEQPQKPATSVTKPTIATGAGPEPLVREHGRQTPVSEYGVSFNPSKDRGVVSTQKDLDEERNKRF